MDLSNYKTVAEAIRVEINEKTGDLYIVFKVIDEELKKDVRKNWNKDIDFLLNGKLLTKEEK